MSGSKRRWSLVAVASIIAGGCRSEGIQSVLAPAADQPRAVLDLWFYFLVASTAVWAVVTSLLLYGTLRAHASAARSDGGERLKGRLIGAGVGLTIVILIGTLFASLLTDRAGADDGEVDLVVEVTGRRFWWEVRYPDERGGPPLVTANEIHLPVGRTARIDVLTADVIHSFWVPNLHGKIDMVPGRTNSIRIHPRQTGVFRGQCAEFCGIQHALMGFIVVVHDTAGFAQWRSAQRRPAAEPTNTLAARGRQVFFAAECSLCHALRGTRADGDFGPDLTHMASRLTLAAATTPNTEGHLGGWITNPDRVKPGNAMPATVLSPVDLTALLRYLMSLR